MNEISSCQILYAISGQGGGGGGGVVRQLSWGGGQAHSSPGKSSVLSL